MQQPDGISKMCVFWLLFETFCHSVTSNDLAVVCACARVVLERRSG